MASTAGAGCAKRFDSTKPAKEDHEILVSQNAGLFKLEYYPEFPSKTESGESHTWGKPFECGFCHKLFSCKVAAKLHESMIHTGEKPFVCELCSERFESRNELYTHHQNRACSCFSELLQLQRAQMLICESPTTFQEKFSEEVFVCDLCTASFRNKGPLKEHFRHTHTDKPKRIKKGPCRSRIQKETPGERRLIEDKEGVKEDKESGKGDAAEGCDDVLDKEEPDDNRVFDSEMPRKRVKTENWMPDEEAHVFDAPISSSKQTIKREPDSDGQTCNDQVDPNEESETPKFARIQTTSFDCYDFNDLIKNNQTRMKAESGGHSPLGASDQSDHDVELPPESNNSTNLKLVYDVEYQAPD